MPDLLAATRRAFVRGILLLLPLAITVLILGWLFRTVTLLTAPGAARLLTILGVPQGALFPTLTALFSLALTLGIVLAVGIVGGNYLGRQAWAFFEHLMMRMPLVRWFYGAARQIMDAFGAPGGGAFQEVVAVEYPRHGIYTLGFVTSTVTGILPESGDPGQESICVFLPTTPNPTSGYTVVVPRSEVVPTSLTVDEGLKLIVSGGFIHPRARTARPEEPIPG